MRTLILVRHAKSSRDDPSLDDHERPLAERGIQDAGRVAKFFAEQLAPVDEVLCSTARRTRDTWALIAEALPGPPPVRYLRSLYLPKPAALTTALRRAHDDSKTVVLVGHEPSLDAFVRSHAASLPEALRERLARGVPTASLVVMELGLARFADFAEQRGQVTMLVTPHDLDGSSKRPAREPQRGERTELTKHTTREQLASLAIGNAFEQLRANVPGARRAQDPEFLHQLRVGVRKLRVHLRLFRGVLGHQRARAIKHELSWLFRLVGTQRELDVFEHATLPTLRGLADQSLQRTLEHALTKEKKQQHARFARALEGARYRKLELALVNLTAELAHAERKGERNARKWLIKHLDEHRERVAGMARESDFSDATAVHELRKELKKFRYAAELGRGGFADDSTKAYLSQLSKLQDMLGAWNDSVVAEAWLERLLRSAPARTRARARSVFAEELGREREASVQGLLAALEELTHTPAFWKE